MTKPRIIGPVGPVDFLGSTFTIDGEPITCRPEYSWRWSLRLDGVVETEERRWFYPDEMTAE